MKGNSARSQKKAAYVPGHNTPTKRSNAKPEYAKDANKRVTKGLGCALTLGTESVWHEPTIILMARLSEVERASLAFATFNKLAEGHAGMAASSPLFGTLHGEVVD